MLQLVKILKCTIELALAALYILDGNLAKFKSYYIKHLARYFPNKLEESGTMISNQCKYMKFDSA